MIKNTTVAATKPSCAVLLQLWVVYVAYTHESYRNNSQQNSDDEMMKMTKTSCGSDCKTFRVRLFNSCHKKEQQYSLYDCEIKTIVACKHHKQNK